MCSRRNSVLTCICLSAQFLPFDVTVNCIMQSKCSRSATQQHDTVLMRYFPLCEVLWKIEKLCLLEILEEEAGKFQYELSGVCCCGNPEVSVEMRKSS